jgi:hypothetical protein
MRRSVNTGEAWGKGDVATGAAPSQCVNRESAQEPWKGPEWLSDSLEVGRERFLVYRTFLSRMPISGRKKFESSLGAQTSGAESGSRG